jgi:hypothetical protein
MTAVRKVVDSNTLTDIFDLPPDFKGKKIEVILFPVEESKEEKSFAPMTMAQIDEWSKVPEIQSLVGVLKGAVDPNINIDDIRDMRLAEKYGI